MLHLMVFDLTCIFAPDLRDEWREGDHLMIELWCRKLEKLTTLNNAKFLSIIEDEQLVGFMIHLASYRHRIMADLIFSAQPKRVRDIKKNGTRCYLGDVRVFGWKICIAVIG
jgi:hypothetical protein